MNDDTTECMLASLIASDVIIRAAQWQQIIGAIIGTTVLLIVTVPPNRRLSTLLTGMARAFIFWTTAFLVIHNICIFVALTWQQILYALDTNGCGYRIITWQCLLLRVPSIGSIVALSAIHVFMVADRFYESHYPQCYYRNGSDEQSWKWTDHSRIFLFVAFITIISMYYVFNDDLPYHMKPYCIANSTRTFKPLMHLFVVLFTVDVLCAFGFALVMRKSYSRLKRNEHNFIVTRKMEMRSNVAALRFMTSSATLRVVLFGTFLATNFLARFFIKFDNFILLARIIDSAYILQWYGCALAALLYYWRPLAHRSLSIGSSSNEDIRFHFKQLDAAWAKPLKQRPNGQKFY